MLHSIYLVCEQAEIVLLVLKPHFSLLATDCINAGAERGSPGAVALNLSLLASLRHDSRRMQRGTIGASGAMLCEALMVVSLRI